jgi:threonine dehydrogenase-like Zn-dependent dehydrogenase
MTLQGILTSSDGIGCNVSVDCSGSQAGRSLAIEGAAEWGRVSLLGEGGTLNTEVSDLLLHKNLTINASWVTSLQGMEELTQLLSSKGLHPEIIVSNRFALSECDEAYRIASLGASGKVVILPNL